MKLKWKIMNTLPTERSFQKFGVVFSPYAPFCVQEETGKGLLALYPEGFLKLEDCAGQCDVCSPKRHALRRKAD